MRGSGFIAVSAGLCLLAVIAPVVGAEVANRIVAVVNDDVITQAELNSRVDDIVSGPAPIPAQISPAQVQRAVLERLIEQKLILQEGKQLGVTVNDEEVMDRLREVKKKIGSEVNYERWLAEMGLTEGQLKFQLRDQLLVQRTVDAKVRSTIVISPQEVSSKMKDEPAKAGVDRAHLLHMLIRVNNTRTEEQAKQLAGEVRSKAQAGTPFAELAKAYSEDPQAEEGGDLGWIIRGQLLPELDTAAFSLPVGTLSDVIQTRLGFHLIRVEERHSGEEISTLEANTATFHELYDNKFQEAMAKWLKELKQHAYIEITGEGA